MKKPIIYMLMAGIFFAMMNVLVKELKEYSIFQIIFFRAFITLIISYIYIRKEKINPFGNQKKLLVLRGVFGLLGLATYFYTLQEIPLATAVSIQYLSPIMTAILAIIINKESTGKWTWFFYILSFLGIVFIKGFDHRIELLVLICGILSALFSGMAYNTIRLIGKRDNPYVVVFYFPLITLPIVLIPTILTWQTPTFTDWFIFLGVGISTQFAQVYMTKAFQGAKLSSVGIFQYIGVIYAICLGYFLYDETYNWKTYLGMLLVVSGAIFNIIYEVNLKRKTSQNLIKEIADKA